MTVALAHRGSDGGVGYDRYSELGPARLVARSLRTHYREITIEPSIVRSLVETVLQLDEPSDMLAPCIFEISELASEHVKVVLGSALTPRRSPVARFRLRGAPSEALRRRAGEQSG